MGVKYVKDFSFPSAGGFHSGSVQRYAKGGHVTKLPAKAKDSAKGMPARAKPNAPARGAPKMESKPSRGKRQGYEEGGYVPGREMDRLPTKRPPGRTMDLAPARRFKGKYEGYAEGGPVAELDAGQPDYVPSKPKAPMYGLLETAPREDIGDIIGVVGGLTPLPEEPIYRERISPALEREDVGQLVYGPDVAPLTAKPQDYDPGLKQKRLMESRLDRALARNSAMQERAGMTRDMMGRPGMRGLARRAAPPRMRAPAPVRQPEVLPFELQPEPLVPVFKKGGAVKGEKIAKVMREYKEGKLHSGSKKGPVVKNPKQAMAIALSEARAAKKAAGGFVNRDYMDYESKGPKTRYTPAKGRREAKERRMEKWAEQRMKHAEKYAPGLSVDMEDESMVRQGKMLKYAKGGKAKHSDVKMDKAVVKKAVHKHEKAMHPGKKLTKLNRGGVPSYGRKPMYGGGKC